MDTLLDLTLRSSVMLAIGLLTSAALRRRSAALRHAVLTAGLVATFAIVPTAWLLPSWSVPFPLVDTKTTLTSVSTDDELIANASVDGAAVTEAVDGEAIGSAPIDMGIDVNLMLVVTWIAGLLLCAAWLATGVFRLTRIARAAKPISDGMWLRLTRKISQAFDIAPPVVLMTEKGPELVATWGWLRPRIVLPAHATKWAYGRAEAVLGHECAHIRRKDWLVQIAAEILRCVLWFNPLVWMVCARLGRESDRACDDLVLGRGMPASDYADHLVAIARESRVPRFAPVMPMARQLSLEGRIKAMLNPQIDRRTPGRLAWMLVCAAIVACLLPLASFDVSAQAGPATFSAVVYDSSGGVLPGVTVVLYDSAKNARKAATSGAGRFEFPSIGPGRYALEASLPGFRTLRSEFELTVPAQWTRAITLQVGTIEETVTVQAARKPVAQTGGAPGQVGPNAPRPVVRVGGVIRPPQKINNVNPVYPPAMQDAGLEGVVPMEALIGADGSVRSVHVVSADVHPAFAAAAEAAVRQWMFTPTRLNNQPVEVRMGVTVRFSLTEQ